MKSVPDLPTCDTSSNRKTYGVGPGSSILVACHLDANPPVDAFRWWFSR
jgi:hypothetical protein